MLGFTSEKNRLIHFARGVVTMSLQYIIDRLKGQTRAQFIARTLAMTGFAVLTVMAILEDNVVFAPLFFLFFLHYIRKLLKQKITEQKSAEKIQSASSNQKAKEELVNMLQYYKQLLKNWKRIALFGWVLSILLVIYARNVIILFPIGLACYSTYALIRCRQAVQLIEKSSTIRGE
jgi:hypothetical protein